MKLALVVLLLTVQIHSHLKVRIPKEEDQKVINDYEMRHVKPNLEKLGYKLIREIGQGTQAVIYKIKNTKNNNYYALKLYDLRKKDAKESAEMEIENLNKLHKFPFITPLIEHFPLKGVFYKFIALVMPFYPMTLQTFLEDEYAKLEGNLPFATRYRFMLQLATAINAMQEAGVSHYDIKPENILMASRTELAVADFGLSLPSNVEINEKNKRGTPLFMPFDYRIAKFNYLYNFNGKHDEYSLGITFALINNYSFFMCYTYYDCPKGFKGMWQSYDLMTTGKMFWKFRYFANRLRRTLLPGTIEFKLVRLIFDAMLCRHEVRLPAKRILELLKTVDEQAVEEFEAEIEEGQFFWQTWEPAGPFEIPKPKFKRNHSSENLYRGKLTRIKRRKLSKSFSSQNKLI